MYSVELYSRVRRACHVEGMSERTAARRFGIDRKTVAKILKHSVPPGYRRQRPPARPKLDGFVALIDQILEDDRARPRKQRHTAKRIFERLRDEYRFAGGITIVTDYVREQKRRHHECQREMLDHVEGEQSLFPDVMQRPRRRSHHDDDGDSFHLYCYC